MRFSFLCRIFIAKCPCNFAGDKQIDFEEFCEIMAASQQTWEEDLRDAFAGVCLFVCFCNDNHVILDSTTNFVSPVLSVFDVDGNGTISADEIATVLADLGQTITKDELVIIMDAVDLDKNGCVVRIFTNTLNFFFYLFV